MDSDVLSLPADSLTALTLAAKTVSEILKSKLQVNRVGLIYEGFGINHAHAKLIPMYDVQKEWKQISSHESERRFYNFYPGFISSHDGPEMSHEELDRIQKIISL